MPLILSPFYLHLSMLPSPLKHHSSQIFIPTSPRNLRNQLSTRMLCVSIRPRRKSASNGGEMEAQDLVRVLMRSFSKKEPMVKTLDRYVKVVRCQHCFLLFEELGKTEKWIQCLEVRFSLYLFSQFLFNFQT